MKEIKKMKIGILVVAIVTITVTMGVLNVGAIAPPPTSFRITLYGYVKDSVTGAGISGAKVVLLELEMGMSKTTYSASNGYYSVTLYVISYMSFRLTASKSGYQSQSSNYYSPGRYRKDFNLKFKSVFTGYIKDRNGDPIEYAMVRLYSNGQHITTSYTSNNGYYSLIGYGVTNTQIRADRTRWITQTKSVNRLGGSNLFNLYSSSCAIVVSGASDKRHNNDAYLMYSALKDHYSFHVDRIFLLTVLPSFDGITIPRDRVTSQANFEWACDQVDSLTGVSDDVMIFWTSHGGNKLLGTGEINGLTLNEMDNALDDINCRRQVVIINSCAAGSFIDDGMIEENNRAILTSCEADESSWGYENSDGTAGHSFFGWGIIQALDEDFSASTADDAPSDDRISVREAFDYAVYYVRYYDQNPMIWEGIYFGGSEYNYFGDQYY